MPYRILIPTSDKTIWALRGCLHQLDKYWPTHPPVHIGGYTPPDFDLPPYATFQSLGAFKDFPADKWSNGLLRFLESQTDDIFLFHMDDFWPVRPIDSLIVDDLYKRLTVSPHVARIDLTSDRANSGYTQDHQVIRVWDEPIQTWREYTLLVTPPVTPYQLSFQTALWRRSALLAYLTPGETAGETEVRGSNRMTLANANVMGTLEAPFRYKIVVQHGKVVIDSVGYQVPEVVIPAEDLDELTRLGYTTPPQTVTE